MLRIRDLAASIDGSAILKGLNLELKAGEVHGIMGPNGSGKSTLSKVLAGHPDYIVDRGSVEFEVNFKYRDLLQYEADERARLGVFLAFQYPIEVPGVKNSEFLRAAFNATCREHGIDEMDEIEFHALLKKKMYSLNIPENFIERQVNVDFSGGEKKRNEILQMAVLSPKLAILDEADSGLDVDSLRIVGEGLNGLKSGDNSFLVITHYKRLLEFIKPDYVHILYDGRIIRSGDHSLAEIVEKDGYDAMISEWLESSGHE
jgi:Fe-S cluster assembly ATP-binding protein